MEDRSSSLDPTVVSSPISTKASECDQVASDGAASAAGESRFQAEWQFDDTTNLQPANLPISRVQRAWERRPQPSFARQKIRGLAKVWKRGLTSHSVSINPNRDQNIYAARAVKKLCLGSGFTSGAASQWEVPNRGSPTRKIVTRSDRAAELVELDETHEDPSYTEQEDVTDQNIEIAGTLTEILDEDGRLISSAKDAAQDLQSEEWDDVAPPTETEIEAEVEPVDTNASTESNEIAVNVILEEFSVNETDSAMDEVIGETTKTNLAQSRVDAVPILDVQRSAIPDGFVSPVKQRRKLGPRASREPTAGRRRTLPMQFAPEFSFTPSRIASSNDRLSNTSVEEDNKAYSSMAPVAEDLTESNATANLDLPVDECQETSDDDVWEDIEEDQDLDEQLDDCADNLVDTAGHHAGEIVMEALVETFKQEDENVDAENIAAPDRKSVVQAAPYLSSPVPTVAGPHPRLPLRRSPRRISSSPLKQSTVQLAPDSSHLVAFSPIKRKVFNVDCTKDDQLAFNQEVPQRNDTAEHMDMTADTSPLRMTSETLEETRTSPQRSSKPRISDDTALLQAFLNKAAEKKTTRRVSAAMKESISNRRDSDTVREALASPAPVKTNDVLMELDVNSPSPRKPSFVVSTLSTKPAIEQSADDADFVNKPAETSTMATEDSTEQLNLRTRSGRSRKKPQVYTPVTLSAPSKISIRASANSVDLRKSEAQELSILTRSNTRKNKGQSVFPVQRLTKIAAERLMNELPLPGQEDDDSAVSGTDSTSGEASQQTKKRSVKWAENLVHFSDAPPSEISQISNEDRDVVENLGLAEDQVSEIDKSATSVSVPLPADTPSKPKVRRLRASRTATSALITAPEPAAVDESSTNPPSNRAMTRLKRSRIATPAKLKISDEESLTPLDVVSITASRVPQKSLTELKATGPTTKPTTKPEEEPRLIKKRKIPTRLPAPSVVSLAASTISATSAPSLSSMGKENMLTSSPAKKKPSTTVVKTASSIANLPKLEFGRSITKFPSVHGHSLGATPSLGPKTKGENDMLPGLASPAKKGRRQAPIYSNPATTKTTGQREERDVGISSSPAKKRTRRGAIF